MEEGRNVSTDSDLSEGDESVKFFIEKVKAKRKVKAEEEGKAKKKKLTTETSALSDASTVTKTKTFRWTEAMMEDLVDLILTSEDFKKYLIFENNKRANGAYYDSLVIGLNTRISKYAFPGPKVSATQARYKFKHLLSECKALALTKKTASGIERARVERGYGDWFLKLYEIAAARPSFNPANNVEPSFIDEGNQSLGEINESLGESISQREMPNFVPRRTYEKSKKKGNTDFQQAILEKIDDITKDDQTQNILNFIKEENEKSRKHEALMMDKLVNMFTAQRSMPPLVSAPHSLRNPESIYQPRDYPRQENPIYVPREKYPSSHTAAPPSSESYRDLLFNDQEEEEPRLINKSFIPQREDICAQTRSPISTICNPPEQGPSFTNASYINYQEQLHLPNLLFGNRQEPDTVLKNNDTSATKN